MENKTELLAPAGDLKRLKIAIEYGADAVFLGGKKLSLRAKANNFEIADIEEAVRFAKKHHARIHVTVNVVPEDEDLEGLDDYLLALDKAGVNAIIVSSIYIMKRAKELGCKFEVHVSTQQSLSNSKAIEFFAKNRLADRAVLARELNINDIREVKEKSMLPIEVFIHGGMCSSYSGRCGLSNVMSDRDANKGGCAHSCRWMYHLKNNGKEVADHHIVLASKDLMAIDYIKELMDIGVDSFKIEGRMKSEHYIATIVNSYRNLIDDYGKEKVKSLKKYKKAIAEAENRNTYTGFLNPSLKNEALLDDVGKEEPLQSYLAIVTGKDKDGNTLLEVRNYFKDSDEVRAFLNTGENIFFTIKDMYDEKSGERVFIANHPKQILKVKLKHDLPVNTFIRKKEK